MKIFSIDFWTGCAACFPQAYYFLDHSRNLGEKKAQIDDLASRIVSYVQPYINGTILCAENRPCKNFLKFWTGCVACFPQA